MYACKRVRYTYSSWVYRAVTCVSVCMYTLHHIDDAVDYLRVDNTVQSMTMILQVFVDDVVIVAERSYLR
jgi:hypothetical protein